MNIHEARKILNLQSNSTQEDIKKQYKKLAKEYHPDTNKDPSATNKLKEINRAYNFIKNYNPRENQEPENIFIEETISFKESVLGTKRQIKYSRLMKCQPCNGRGYIRKNNGCKKCNGQGQITVKQKDAVFISTCLDCLNNIQMEPCNSCYQSGSIMSDLSLDVSIPPLKNNDVLRLSRMGNFAGSMMMIEHYTDAFLKINVIPNNNFSVDEKGNIFHQIDISLLDALKGIFVKIPTLDEDKIIEIPSKTKNKDEIISPISDTKKQRTIININYPEDVTTLIKILEPNVSN